MIRSRTLGLILVLGSPAIAQVPAAPSQEAAAKEPDFPSFEAVTKGTSKVVSTVDGKPGMYTLYEDRKDGRLFAVLPSSYEKQLVMIATTVASGDEEAGVMGGSTYARWKRFGKRIALIEPDFLIRSHGDAPSKDSVKALYTDRVILDVPIASMKGSKPVVDLKGLFVGQHARFFGPTAGYGPSVVGAQTHLATLQKAKAFPQNIEVAYQVPNRRGRLVSLHYSLRALPKNPGFEPREADNRVGYFNVYYREMGRPESEEPYTRYITRWHIEKADPSLHLSPPKKPLVWYIEHTTPIRYRRHVRDGILAWNKAFERIGIVDAIEVYQQDATTGAYMDIDPEDARYNFFRWNSSTQGYAIGPSRWDPRTGEILDADVVWHMGLLTGVRGMLKELSGDVAMTGMHPETIQWLDEHPEWDPRIRLAPAAERGRLIEARRAKLAAMSDAERTVEALADPATQSALLAHGRVTGQSGGECKIGDHLALNVSLLSSAFQGGLLDEDEEEDEEEEEQKEDIPMLDGLPEAFIGGMIRYISAHEVGHTLGLQHNFGASTIRSLADINSEAMKGQPFIASVMEYAGVNINKDDGEVQGDYATPSIGPYDEWAIAFGYGPAKDREKVLAQVADPDHVFLNDISTIGPDPRAQTWDMGADPLNFAESRMRIVQELRGKITDELVEDGEPWRKARDRYHALLSNQVMAMVVAQRWIGGSYVHWDYKGDPNGRDPVTNVEVEKQRRALEFVIENSFRDEAFGLTPELLHKLGTQYWPDAPGYDAIMDDPSYEVHDTVSGIQATALSILLGPTRLRRIYDNEFRTRGEEDVLTLVELFDTIHEAVWSELAEKSGSYSARRPMISSLRRNLQREHTERLIDLSMPDDGASASARTIANLAVAKLRTIHESIEARGEEGLDPYTSAHLADCATRIEKALESVYVANGR